VSVRRAHILACLSCSVFLGRVLSGPTRLLCTLRCQARPFRYYLGGWVSIYSPAFESFHAVFRSKFQFLTPQNLRARFLSREEKKGNRDRICRRNSQSSLQTSCTLQPVHTVLAQMKEEALLWRRAGAKGIALQELLVSSLFLC
jgi:hypothetical protein